MLRARKAQRTESLDKPASGPIPLQDKRADPENEALLADSVGLALLVLLDTLTPAERLASVLHDMFDLPFEEIAALVGCSPAAARQHASRARRRVWDGSAVPKPTSTVRGRLSMPLWQLRVEVISMRCLRCSIRMSCSGPTVLLRPQMDD